MTVADLREQLEDLPGDWKVFCDPLPDNAAGITDLANAEAASVAVSAGAGLIIIEYRDGE